MEPSWSNRLWGKLINSDYAIKKFPDWVEIAYKRYWSVYKRWYGL